MTNEDNPLPYDENLRLERICAVCGKSLQPVDQGGPNQMDNAMDLEIRGYWGTTVFDGTDITGICLMGFACDDCGRPLVARMSHVQKYTDHRIKPGSPEWEELRRQLLDDAAAEPSQEN